LVSPEPGFMLVVFSGIFFVDIFLRFFSGLVIEGNLIMDPGKIVNNYIKYFKKHYKKRVFLH